MSMDEYIIKSYNSNILEETYGCSKKYICALNIYLLTIDSLTFKLSTDRAISSPSHGKYFVDGLHVRYKSYPREQMNSLSKILP